MPLTITQMLIELREFVLPANLLTVAFLAACFYLLRSIPGRNSLKENFFLRMVFWGWLLNFLYLVLEIARFYYQKYGGEDPRVLGSAMTLILILGTLSSACFMHGSLRMLLLNRRWVRDKTAPALGFFFIAALFALPKESTSVAKAILVLNVTFHAFALVLLAVGVGRFILPALENHRFARGLAITPIYAYAILQMAYLGQWLSKSNEGSDLMLTAGFSVAFLLKLTHLGAIVGGYTGNRFRRLQSLDLESQNLNLQKSLISQMAHELVTPAAELRLNVEELISSAHRGSKADLHDSAQETQEVTSRILAIVSGTYDVIGLENEKIRTILGGSFPRVVERHREICNVNNTLHSAVIATRATFANTLSEKISIQTDYAAEPLTWGHRFGLMQVFINILKNSFEALGERGGSIRITTRKERETNSRNFKWSIATISDTGPGISETEFELITLEGYSTKKGVGRGHGLAIAKRIVNEHDGNIFFSCRDHDIRGMIVRVRLPYADEEPDLKNRRFERQAEECAGQ